MDVLDKLINNLDTLMQMDDQYAKAIKWVYRNHPSILPRLLESLSPNQIECKQWLVDELSRAVAHFGQWWKEDKYNFEIIGGWYAYPLLHYLNEYTNIPIGLVRNVDIDSLSGVVSNKYIDLFQPKFEYVFVNEDIMSIPQHNPTRQTRIVINTSCEHMPPMKDIVESRGYIKDKILGVYQSNNKYDEPDHINCVDSVVDLVNQSGMTRIFYSGEKDMGNYKRFMIVGRYD